MTYCIVAIYVEKKPYPLEKEVELSLEVSDTLKRQPAVFSLIIPKCLIKCCSFTKLFDKKGKLRNLVKRDIKPLRQFSHIRHGRKPLKIELPNLAKSSLRLSSRTWCKVGTEWIIDLNGGKVACRVPYSAQSCTLGCCKGWRPIPTNLRLARNLLLSMS